MFITISDVSKGKPFRFQSSIDNTVKKLKIGIRSITTWVGWYNVYKETICRWGEKGRSGESTEIPINPGLYKFEQLVKLLTDGIDDLSITVNPINGIIDMSIPPNIQLWLPSPIQYLFGLDDDEWLEGNYAGDRAIEFEPKRLIVYLKQLSTTGNLAGVNDTLQPSQILETIPISLYSFGGYETINYSNPIFKNLTSSYIQELDFDFKVEWGNGTKHKLDNHSQPIDIVLEIRE